MSTDPLSLRSLKIGDEVVVTSSNHITLRRRVERIGRKYLYTGERCPGFDLDTGRQNDNHGNTHARTPAGHERRLRADHARQALNNAYRLPEDCLLAIYDLLKERGLL